jgi:hypothetical protein
VRRRSGSSPDRRARSGIVPGASRRRVGAERSGGARPSVSGFRSP